MKVLILGYGGVGRVLTRLLLKDNRIKEIICGDIKFIDKVESKKVLYEIVDVLDKRSFVEFLRKLKPDVAVNLTIPKFNEKIMEACAEAEVNYLDTASYWDLDKNPKAKSPYLMEQMNYDEKFKKKGIIGLIESGVAPGLDNLMVAECASKLDLIDYIKIRMCEDTGSNEIFFSWNKDWLLDELGWHPLVYENGKFRLEKQFGAEEEVNFPAPIGKKKTYYFAQDEAGSIPLYIKTKKLDVKIYDNNIEASKLMYALGLISEKEIDVDGIKIKPVRVLSKLLPDTKLGDEKRFPKSVFAIAIEVIGKKAGKKKTIKFAVVFPNQKEIEKLKLDANFITYPTALSAKNFILAIPRITDKTGVFPPEALSAEIRKSIFADLKKFKLKFIKNF